MKKTPPSPHHPIAEEPNEPLTSGSGVDGVGVGEKAGDRQHDRGDAGSAVCTVCCRHCCNSSSSLGVPNRGTTGRVSAAS